MANTPLQTALTSGTHFISLTLLAVCPAVWACTAQERAFTQATEGEGGLGGEHATGGSGGRSGGSGGTGGEGGASSGGHGTGGQTTLGTITCAGVEHPAPEVDGDWACQTFDGAWPPEEPWSLTGTDEDLEVVDDLFVSSPSSLRLNVPASGVANAKLSWSNTAGDDIEELRLEFELMHNPLAAAPPAWDEPLAIACVDFGQTEGCLLYQWGADGYSLRVTNYQTIPDIHTCDLPVTVPGGSWSSVTLTLDDAGNLVSQIEDEDPVTCSQDSTVVGTVASFWVGMEGSDASRLGYTPRMDNVFAIVSRE